MSAEGLQTSPQEKGHERIFTREEILSEISKYCENPTVTNELSDENGIYHLSVEVAGELPGEIIEFIYSRKTRAVVAQTVINIMYYKDGEIITGLPLSQYNQDAQKWEKNGY